jgi:hypothetical protein
MNISLLCKWWWRLENEKGLWQGIIKAKYLQDEGVSTAKHKFGDSPIWTDIHSPEGQTDNHPKWETDIVLEGRLAGRQTHSHYCTYRWPFGPPGPARPKHDTVQARNGPARHGPTDFVLVLGGTMG